MFGSLLLISQTHVKAGRGLPQSTSTGSYPHDASLSKMASNGFWKNALQISVYVGP